MVLKRINQKPQEIQEIVQLDPQIGCAIMKGLDLDPRERWQTMTEMLTVLRDAYTRLSPLARKEAVDKKLGRVTVKKKRRADHDDKWQFKTQ
jgi:hypothetical protein